MVSEQAMIAALIRFSLADRLRSVRYAASGIAFMFKTQHNAWIHATVTIATIGAGWALNIHPHDWRWLALALILVWTAEATNTAFEYLCDVISPQYHPSVEKAKDIAAGAVLICSAGAVAIGALTLTPYLMLAYLGSSS
jgi:diacylglycerol kinase (ATP)